MTKIYMVWLLPTVTALLATGISGVLHAEQGNVSTGDSGWNISTSNPSVSDVDTPENTISESQLKPVVMDESSPLQANQLQPDMATPVLVSDEDIQQEPLVNESDPSLEQISTNEDSVTEQADSVVAGASQVEQIADADQTYIPGETAEPPLIPEESSIQQAQLTLDLEQQYQQLRRTLETEDSFSPVLGEAYYGYGMLLRDASRFDEAMEAFTDALHIEKINNGIYSLEQRASLKAMFETHFALGNTEDYEDYLERILWIESKNPDIGDDISFKLQIMVGNQYLDQFLQRPIAGQASLQKLLRAKHHLVSAIRGHGDKPIALLLMPYGELALISFLESRMQPDVDKTASMEDPRLRSSRTLNGRELALSSYFVDSFPRGESYLMRYLNKAREEQRPRHAVRALISLGDFNQLFKNKEEAMEYYLQAWEAGQSSGNGDILLSSFSQPVSLPDFQYSVFRQPIIPTRPSVLVLLTLEVDKNGKVRNVADLPQDHEYIKYFNKARRSARRLIFRPKMVDGDAVVAEHVDHQIRVPKKK